MIYPTRRAIYLLLAGAPMALALGLIRPELWLVAPGWIGVILACLILDTVAGANPRHLTLDARFPHQVGVGDAFELSLTARGRSLPQRAELALGELLRHGAQPAVDLQALLLVPLGALHVVVIVRDRDRGIRDAIAQRIMEKK